MKAWLATAGLIVSLIQGAVELVKSFEVGGFGVEKKNVVLSMLESTYGFIKEKFDVSYAWSDVKGVVSTAIDAIVGFMNTVGIFKK